MQSLVRGPAPPPHASLEERLERSLGRLAEGAARTAPGRWQVMPSHGGETPVTVTVAVVGDWLIVERDLDGCRLARFDAARRWAWRLLQARPPLPSGARPVLDAGDGRVRMRAERAVSRRRDDADAMAEWVEAACADVVAPFAAGEAVGLDGAAGVSEGDDAPAVDLAALCASADWPAAPRGAPGEVSVALPARDGGVCHAIAAPEGDAVSFRVTLEVDAAEETTPVARSALAVALLRVAGCVRLVRATAGDGGGRVFAALDVHLAPPLRAESVGHALSALAVAHRQISAELDAVARDDSLASAYLVMQGAHRGRRTQSGAAPPRRTEGHAVDERVRHHTRRTMSWEEKS